MVISSKCGSSALYSYLSGGSENVDADRDGVAKDRHIVVARLERMAISSDRFCSSFSTVALSGFDLSSLAYGRRRNGRREQRVGSGGRLCFLGVSEVTMDTQERLGVAVGPLT